MKYESCKIYLPFLLKRTLKILLFLILCFLFTSCSDQYNSNKHNNGNKKIIQLSNWQYYTGNDFGSLSGQNKNIKSILCSSGKWESIPSLSEIPFSNDNKIIWLKSKLPDWKGTDPSIYFRPAYCNFQVFINNKFVFQRGSFTNKEEKYIWWNENLIQLPYYKKGDDIIFGIKLDKRFHSVPGKIFFGSSPAFINIIFKHDVVNLFIIPVFLLCGLAAFLLYLFLKRIELLLGLFLFLFSVGILVAVHTPFLLLIFPYSGIFFHSNYIAFYLVEASFFYLIALVVIKKYKRIINFIWKFKVSFLFLSIPVFSFTNLQFIDIMKYEIILDILLAVTAFSYLFLSIRKNKLQRNIFIIALTSVLISMIVELLILFDWGFNGKFGYSIRVFHFGAIIFVSALIWLAYNNYTEAQREKEMIRRNEFEAVKRENKIRHNFTVRLLESQEAERNRIALELHDSVGQKLLLIRNHVLSKIKMSPQNNDLETFREVSDLTDETIQEVRNITYNLRPQYLDQLGLTAAVETIAEKISESSGINVNLNIDENIDDLFSKNDEINFFRIIQESLNNIVKHSGADEAFVNIKKDNNIIILRIADSGNGFQSDSIIEGTGITGMRERAKILGAEFNMISDKNGTIIKMELPA